MLPLVTSLAVGLLAADAPAKPVDFNREVRPILSDYCFACHGPDEANRKAGLRFDIKEGAIGKVVIPGDPAKSRLFVRMSHENKARRMPPPAFGRQPDDKQIALVKRWIEQGADWKTHWAYDPPKRVEPPPVALKSWPKNTIDRFVLARLEKEGLKPSPEAAKTTLLRRLTLDLTGLPPTSAEIDAFLADKSPNAYEKQVDRLLAKPQYGERMAMMWLDLARYADTHGYHIDSHRDMWPWREWVIRAFNNNLPFDRFTVEQIAGDLLPNPTKDQIIATGFNRNHMINYEGGAIPEEYLVEYVADRVETTSNVWMAMTMGCARCHDHKYDPIKQADFYRFFAFFNTVKEKGLDGMAGNAEPLLPLPDDGQKARLEKVKAAIAAREAQLPEKKVDELLAKWEASQTIDLAGPVSLRNALQFHYDFEGNTLDTSGRYRHARVMGGEPGFSNSGVGRGIDFNGENTHISVGPAELSGPFTLAFWMRFNQPKEGTILRKPGAIEVWHEKPVAIPRLRRAARIHIDLGNGTARYRTKEALIFGELKHLTIVQDAGIKLFVDGKPFALDLLASGPISQMQSAEPIEIGAKPSNRERFKGQMDDLRLYSRVISEAEIAQLAIHQPVPPLLSIPKEKRTKPQKDALRDYFLAHQSPAEMREAYLDLKQLRAAKVELDEEIPTTMVMGEAEKPRDTFILARGDYRNAKDKVTPAVPSVLPPLPANSKVDRLALAKWLVDPSHPLTARVAVNRYWQMYFGLGLVKTSEDFGSQGEPPSHPELLDWLADEFVKSGWDVKAMQRLIVTSATYRQSSKVTPDLLERDPQNRLLARMSRYRLPAETVRDNALAIAGLLNPEIGGKSVYPYQPPGLWEELAYGDRFSAQTYTPSHGKDLYRRSMYWFWKRTVPPATLATFDAPDREKCTSRRAVTNTPLQALILLNDPTYLEAARALASQAILSSTDFGKRISTAFRAATGRAPNPRETRLLKDLITRQMEIYGKDTQAAEDLLKAGESPWDKRLKPVELAAWTTVASAILNMDEVITKE
jgi:hypothetical protein